MNIRDPDIQTYRVDQQLPNLFDMVIVGYHDDSSLDATRETIREDPEARIKVQHFW